MNKLKFKSDDIMKIIFIFILLISLLFNALFFFGKIESKSIKTKKTEFIDSPVLHFDTKEHSPDDPSLILPHDSIQKRHIIK